MPKQPNILFLMADQMQAQVLEKSHPCQTPNLNRLAARGIRFQCAYTPNAVCSPARASLMTGLLPHNHGVHTVYGDVAPDKSVLRDKPHWAQSLKATGYNTGYFGKWHVEASESAANFGWQVDCGYRTPHMEAMLKPARTLVENAQYSLLKRYETPGYAPLAFYGVTPVPAEERPMGIITREALKFINESAKNPAPWCCFASFPEPHDPYITGEAAYAKYDAAALNLPSNVHDTLEGRPGVYRKMARVWKSMSDIEHRQARACYFASITEMDNQFGRLLDALETNGQVDNTIVIMTADHGDLMGAHGMYCKGYTAAEEIYNIPLIVAGPGMARNAVSRARVGLHDVCPTLLELLGLPSFSAPDSRSFRTLLEDPNHGAKDFMSGYAEYHGSRVAMLQRIAWRGRYKYVLNGFDFDELYDLEEDPSEMKNLIDSQPHRGIAREMLTFIWERIRETHDPALEKAQYPMWRIGEFGPCL
jgi:arylsulfatase A-like enzyme